MKNFISLIIVGIFTLFPLHTFASLGLEQEYWLEEIEKHDGLSGGGVYRFLNGNWEEHKKVITTIAKVVQQNPVKLKHMAINMYRNDQAIREILSNILLPAIANNDTIKTLNLNGLPESAAPLIAKIIEKNKTLEYVTLSDPGFDNRGAIAIAKALKSNSTIKNLSFTGSNFGMEARKAIRSSAGSNVLLEF